MRALALLAAAALWWVVPTSAAAQQGECSLDRTPRVNVQNSGTPWEMAFLGGPVLICPGDMRITADSAVYTAAISEVHFIGRVRFRDPERRLDADFAQYRIEARELAAQGNVEFTDLANGSTIRSPALDYLMEGPTRPEARVEVYSGRPRTILVSRAEAEPDSTIVDSDALTIIGERTFIGRGDVVLRRGELDGRGAELEYDQLTGSLELRGDALLETPEYRLAGHTVVAAIEQDTLRQVHAVGDATLVAEEIDVTAPYIDIRFADGLLARLVAVRRAPGAESDTLAAPDPIVTAAQPRVISPDFVMNADSIDVEAPGQRIERLFAVGAAYAERVPTDSAEIAAADTLPPFLARDWVRGDTIVATFADAPEASADTVVTAAGVLVAAADTLVAVPPAADAERPGRDRVLETLVVFGGEEPASSAYRMRDENAPADAEPGFNYLLARRIEVSFRDGAVERVDAEGDIKGVYITPTAQSAPQPQPQARRRP
jgi:hypothetical protein